MAEIKAGLGKGEGREEGRGRGAGRRGSQKDEYPNDAYDEKFDVRQREEGYEYDAEPEDTLPPASMDDLDDYLELLYEGTGKSEQEKEEGLRAQIRGSAMILKLSRDVMNLEQLIQNATGNVYSSSCPHLPHEINP